MIRKNKIVIGTRGSSLALWQANSIKKLMCDMYPYLIVNIVIIKTKGDKAFNVSFGDIGEKGVFIKEIEEALINGEIDIAVHSMKDMPTEIPRELVIAAIPKREDPRDVIISNKNFSLFNLKIGSKLGTSSLRRISQLFYWRSDLKIVPLRGNLGTRINKFKTEDLDGIVLAAAGIKRLGYKDYVCSHIETDIILPAVGQGALCIESRRGDFEVIDLISFIDDLETRSVVIAERAFLSTLGGGCHVPIAANGVLHCDNIILRGVVASIDGSELMRKVFIGSVHSPIEVGKSLAEIFLTCGARSMLS